MKTHNLKTINPYFSFCWMREKNFDIRLNDRDYQVGDKIILQEYDAYKKVYLGREITAYITYILFGYHALTPGYVVISFEIESFSEREKDH